MDIKEFMIASTRYIEDNLFPLLAQKLSVSPEKMSWFGGGLLALAANRIGTLANDKIDLLKSLGIIDENNSVNVDNVKIFLDSAFNAQKEFVINPKEMLGLKYSNPLTDPYLDNDITFRKEDADRFIETITNNTKGNTQNGNG